MNERKKSKDGGRNKSNSRNYSGRNRNDRNCQDKSIPEDRGRGTAKYDHSSNDPNWYAANPALLKDAGSFSFNSPLGTSFSAATFGYEAVDVPTIPGICRLQYVPTFGISVDNNSAVNIAARRYYAFNRFANSGARNYDSPDLMIMNLGVLEAFVYWAYMVRVYGLLNCYKFKNRYLPKALLETMGLNFNDLVSNMAQLRYYINQYAAKLSCVCVPGDMPYIQRAMWCVTHIWKDSDDDKAQMYYLQPACFYKYDEMSDPNGGKLVPITNGAATYNNFVTVGDDIINALITSEDVGIMSGDTLKAWGSDKILKVAPIPSDFVIEPEFNEAVCLQLQNATAWGSWPKEEIYQDPDTGSIIYNPSIERTNLLNYYPEAWMLNVRGEGTPETVMVGTRLTNLVNRDGTKLTLDSCGSEIVTSVTYFYFNEDGQVAGTPLVTNLAAISNEPTILKSIIHSMVVASNFDYHPMVVVSGGSAASDNTDMMGIFGDIDNYTILTKPDIKRLHDCAILSLLNSPGMGSLSLG